MKESRNTIQRRLVLDAVRELHNHPTAEEVYVYITEKYGNISKATIYSNLQLLSNRGELKRLDIPSEPTRYDHQFHDEYHFMCNACGKLFDSDVICEEMAIEKMKNQSQFQIDEINVILTGICPACKNK